MRPRYQPPFRAMMRQSTIYHLKSKNDKTNELIKADK